MQTFKLKVITPEKIFFEGEAVQIIARTTAGNIGILVGHTPYVANIVPSPLRIKTDSGDERVAAVSAGAVRADKDEVTVVASAVEWAEDIDVARAQKAKEFAENRMHSDLSQKEFEIAEQKLKRALNRISVAGKN